MFILDHCTIVFLLTRSDLLVLGFFFCSFLMGETIMFAARFRMWGEGIDRSIMISAGRAFLSRYVHTQTENDFKST